MVKQVIVVRKDLKMPAGKIASQVAHASNACILKNLKKINQNKFEIELTDDTIEWLGGCLLDKINHKLGVYTKICLGCDGELEIHDLAMKADELNIQNAVIEDSGKTVFNGIPTVTCIGIGPADSVEIDKITKHLKLL